MSNRAKKVKIRQGHRSYVSKIVGNVYKIVHEFEPTDEAKLRQFQITLQEKLDTLKTLDEEILDGIEEEGEILDEIEDAGKFRERIHGAMVEIEYVLCKAPENQEVPWPFSGHYAGKQTKLPKLVLKKFSSEPSDWQSFWDSFRSAVRENTGLSDVDKFNYLKGFLDSSTASTIASLPLTSANFEAAVKLLQQRFGNKQVIVSSHMDSLLKITPMISSADVKKT